VIVKVTHLTIYIRGYKVDHMTYLR